ncbi:Heat shock protein 70 family [Penicillium cf. griseofulvum]|uniref:Heat shock protein 70 family n=1 Tax=Penicillium cf. griseofulvum TaxID=2972120 RepID=A0A9W9T3P7_9EURO|nr:Heat shock protein 70 family [Penicillium cf. griseofulvum]KAJ5445789.1 Heat shock protein 70 family [Penicillium cf. griseofulvum]
MTDTEERPKIIVGIDFGTTFSGVAWGLKDCPDDIELIQTWPGGGNITSQKVPTLCSYDDQRMKWGHQTDQSSHPGTQNPLIQGVKLLLDESQKFRYAPAIESQGVIKDLKKTPVEVAGDYLEKLVVHAREVLTHRFGTALKAMDLEYILTTPAVWSDKGKDLTMQAAHRAGISPESLGLLSEPEAAAVCAIRTIQPNSVTKDDCLVVCDAGGGTVDIITYRVKQTDPLRVEEATKGTGAVCGSVMLDERFDALIKDTIEKQSHQPISQSTVRAARKYWQDYIKPGYTGPLDDDDDDMCEPGYWIPVPGVSGISNIELSEGHLYLDRDQVKGIFDPIIKQVENLVAEQRMSVKATGHATKAIILVGGLGASGYLFKRLQAASDGIQVMQPPNAWSAVARGAVIRGQEGNQVDSRISRGSYGTEMQVEFDPKKHRADENLTWCPYEERWNIRKRMKWYILKNDHLEALTANLREFEGKRVAEGEPIRISFYRVVGVGHSLVFRSELLFCEKTIAPEVIDSSVTYLCELVTDLSKIPKELFTKKMNSSRQPFYHIAYELVLTPTSASLLLDLQFNGVSYGSVKSRY